jgi:hypothetical protein
VPSFEHPDAPPHCRSADGPKVHQLALLDAIEMRSEPDNQWRQSLCFSDHDNQGVASKGPLREAWPHVVLVVANYSLDAAAGLQHGPVAGGLIFRHTSRHLIDLPKSEGVDWNLAGAHLDVKTRVRHAQVDAHATAGVILRYTSVDYTGEISGAAGVERGIGRRVVLRVAADLDYIKTDPVIAGRMGFLNRGAECAVRVKGQSGTLELFARGERRNDPIPLQTGERTGALLGFRLRFAKQ